MRRFIAHYEAWLLSALIPLVCLAGAWAVLLALPLPAGDEFNFVHWEFKHLPGKWLHLTERFLGGGLSRAEEDERLERFLVLSARIRSLERAPAADGGTASRQERERLRRERDALENDVEAIIEGRLTAVLEDADLDSSFPLFPDARWVFPPVDFEFDRPLRVLAVSPRDRIELIEQRPLDQGLNLEEVLELENTAEEDGRRSALVEAVTGAATYPSIIAPQDEYQRLVEVVAHEWVHHYLFFQPLGRRYFSSLELKTLNETVASLAGEELGRVVVQRFPLAPATDRQLSALSPPEPAVDVDSVLRRLRLEVEVLLSQGQVDEAEALMDQRRRELAEGGVVFRRINQAFFASRSVYADSPASIDPLGLKLVLLRARAGSVAAFLRAASKLTGAADLDELLAGVPRGAGDRGRR